MYANIEEGYVLDQFVGGLRRVGNAEQREY